jgi:hypothetical protein
MWIANERCEMLYGIIVKALTNIVGNIFMLTLQHFTSWGYTWQKLNDLSRSIQNCTDKWHIELYNLWSTVRSCLNMWIEKFLKKKGMVEI